MVTFSKKSDVIDYLSNACGMSSTSGGAFFEPGTYYLNHGEYSQPDYEPRRYKDGWGIHANYYYHPGTFGAPADGRVNINVLYAQDALVEDLIAEGAVETDALMHLEITTQSAE